ncbi:polycystic kidney disease protein 1-like 1 isoform X7 [Otolemur garnettii]|uniref:polycystic kidney disease protein 1-like 1 isoform X7 n=1 Tax=Otolemur garnettii TaxID=30611 RepID=UPI000C7EB464|nr:polycystic kidney disease protein 1-like 1 isoform X7 [Otolemur garnettii]
MGTVCLGLGWRVLLGALPLFSWVQLTPGVSSKDGSVGGSRAAYRSGQDWPTQGMAKEVAKGISGDQERCLQATCSLCFHEEESGRLHLRHCHLSPPCMGEGVDVCASLVLSVQYKEYGCPPCDLQGQEEDPESRDPSLSASWEKNILKTTSKEVLCVVRGTTGASLDPDRGADSSQGLPPGTSLNSSLSTSQSCSRRIYLLIPCPPAVAQAQDPDVMNHIICHFWETEAQAPLNLEFHVSMASGLALCLVMGFGDSSRVEMRLHNTSEAMAVTACHQRETAVSVYTNGTVFAADTDIVFAAVTKAMTPLEFAWYFGEDPPVRTTSRSIKKRFSVPQWYLVTVKASDRVSSVVSEPHLIRVQKTIVANRLVSPASALVNATVAFECRINFGTDVAYLWDFGDGTVTLGSSTSSHVYSREGQFAVEVRAFNDISATTLRKQLFIVSKPCQPPLVKNMGPGKVQVWRSQAVRLGVTFEAAVLCDISQGLSYTWSLTDSEGSPVPLLAAVNTHRQTLVIPSYTLESGNYTALAKVQIEGSVVHSNYSVGLEVQAQAPVSVISEGTHLFVPRTASPLIVLRGTQSFDPDNPEATLRYHWKCTAASLPGQPCFASSTPHRLDTWAPTFSFVAKWLSGSYDQFLVTLTVSSGLRNSSEAQAFLSTRSDSAFRFIHISWVNFKDTFVNWNEELSLQAVCEGCGEIPNLSYSWDLFLVNATEKNRMEVPFCRAAGLLGSSGFSAILKSSEPSPLSSEPTMPDPDVTATLSSRELSLETLSQTALSALGRPAPEPTAGVPRIPAAGDSAVPGEVPKEEPPGPEPGPRGEGALMTGPPERSGPPANPAHHLSDFEAYYGDVQEAIPSRGRQLGNNATLPGSGPSLSVEEETPGEGDNLLGPSASKDRAVSVLLVDWPKALLGRALFQGYAASGITEQTVTIKPFSLSSGETYVLQASVASEQRLLGKAQLYVTVNQAPGDVACQVQPPRGLEAHTVFSIFCTSGKPDFLYEFSYHVGNASTHTLYRGRDSQYYFSLPSGEPLDDYRVLVSTEITDGKGSKVQPCAVAVTVLPYYRGSDCLDEGLYNSSLKSLITLQLMGNYIETRNYITMTTKILSRLSKENRTASCGQWSRIQDALISSVCKLAFANEEEMADSVLMLRNLISFSNKLSRVSAVLILKYSRALLAQGWFSGRYVTDRGLRLDLIHLISRVWDISEQEQSRGQDYLGEEAIAIITDVLLGCLALTHISAGQMEFQTLLHHNLQSSVQSLGSVQVHLPADLTGHSPAGAETQSPCYISQLVLFKKSPYPEPQAPGQDQRRNTTTFVLLRDKVNFHQFTGLSENPQESLQIEIRFSKPITRAFPIMLLVRFSEKPTPSDFLVKQIYFWDENVIQMYVPAVSQKDANIGYLSLLDVDYDRKAPNKYLVKAVNYTIHFQWIRCLFWDKKEWKSGSFSPQPGTSPGKVNCSYDRLATAFSVLRRRLNASYEASDISQLQSHPENLLLGIFIVVFMIFYGFLVAKSRRVDHYEMKKAGYIFLQEAPPPGHSLYAVVIDTGFRAPARFTSKVYIVLCGENGLSETKELYCSEKPLFERNSRHTFILSAPDQLGPLRKVRLWHDSSGPSPGWFLSHVMVKALHTRQGWFFPAQCWLSASWCDGRVERELTCLHGGLGFWKLFYCKFTEYLEDFHVWLSVYSRPSSSRYLHTPRLTVTFSLLCVYACLTALITAAGQDQLLLDVGPPGVMPRPFRTGLLCAFLASPGAQLLSLLFRLSKAAAGPSQAEPLGPMGGAQTEATRGPNSRRRTPDAQEMSRHHASVTVLGNAWTKAASSDGAACPPPELEAHGANHGGTALRGESRLCLPRSQAPSSGLAGVAPRRRAPLPWAGSAVWAICVTLSLGCGMGTGFLGYRFSPAQCVWWLHLLSLSVACCVFVTQPLMICLMALGFAWKRRDDNQFFRESLCDATRNLDSELEERSRTRLLLSSSCGFPDCAAEVEQVLAARQQARRLRWACPPSTAQLKVTRERMRRESRMQAALRDLSTYILMLLLLLCITYGRFSQDEYSLNQAIRKEFTRNARNALGGLRSVADWWDWSLTVLLDGLYEGGPAAASGPGAQAGALGGKCFLIGSPIIQQLKVSPSSSSKPLGTFSALTEDPLPTCNPEVRGPKSPNLTEPQNQNVTPDSPRGCGAREDCVLSLGRTRREAHMALAGLRASRWIDGSTRAVSVYFTLYNPPTRLFSSLSVSVEILPTGGLAPSYLVESFGIFCSDSAESHLLLLLQLVLLVLSLVHFCLRLYSMMEKDVLICWRKPRNWLELSVTGVSLAYYVASSYQVTLARDVIDQLHQGLSQVCLDLTIMASWNQRVRWLQGILLFLLMLKCIYLPGIHKTMVSCASVKRPSVFVPVVAGALLLAAGSHLRWALPSTGAPPSGTFTGSFPGLLLRLPGRNQRDLFLGLSESDSGAARYCVALSTVTTLLCLGMLKSSLMSLTRKRKSSQSKYLVRLKDVAAYTWEKAVTFLGLEIPKLEEVEMAENHNYYLDEFANLLDELLMKINCLSDSLQLPLLERQSSSVREGGAEDRRLVGISSYQTTEQTREWP